MGLFQKPLGDIDNRRLQRLREKLVGYNFEVKWVEGKSHLIADALSRYPVDKPADVEMVSTILNTVDNDVSLSLSSVGMTSSTCNCWMLLKMYPQRTSQLAAGTCHSRLQVLLA